MTDTEIKPRYIDPDAAFEKQPMVGNNVVNNANNTNNANNLDYALPGAVLARTDTRPIWNVICENKIIVLVIVIIIILTSLLAYVIFYYKDKSSQKGLPTGNCPVNAQNTQNTSPTLLNTQLSGQPNNTQLNNTQLNTAQYNSQSQQNNTQQNNIQPNSQQSNLQYSQQLNQQYPQQPTLQQTNTSQPNLQKVSDDVLANFIERSQNIQANNISNNTSNNTSNNINNNDRNNHNDRNNLVAPTISGKSDDEIRQLMEDSTEITEDGNNINENFRSDYSGSGESNDIVNTQQLTNSAIGLDHNNSDREGLCTQMLQSGRLCKGKAGKNSTKCSRHS